MRVVIVGPCGSGKSTLAAQLAQRGYDAHIVAQEHSRVRELWRHGGEPDALIYLDASPPTITARRHNNFPAWLYAKQQQRLASARSHASLYLHTDRLSAAAVEHRVVDHLQRVRPATH